MVKKTGVFAAGDRVQFKDAKGRPITCLLETGGVTHSHKGIVNHNSVIGKPYASVIENELGVQYIAMIPTYSDTALAQKRGAAIIYPKDAASIALEANIKHGDRILECGLGSGALAMYILQILGDTGELVSFEAEEKHAEIAVQNVNDYFQITPPARKPNWSVFTEPLENADLKENSFDSVIYDMLDPWNHLALARKVLRSGGNLVCYVTTTTQLSRLTEAVRDDQAWTEPISYELMRRPWHLQGLSVRPEHAMIAHTGYIFSCRRLADGSKPIWKRPASGKGYNDIDR